MANYNHIKKVLIDKINNKSTNKEGKLITREEKDFHIETVKNMDAKDLSYYYYVKELEGRKIYKEYPVDIETFINDDYYLGKIYHGNIFPIWEKLLKEVHPAPLITAYDEIIISAGTRSGKSTSSAISMLYEIYKLLCMVDPAGYFINKSSGRLVFGLLSFSEDNIKKYVKDIENGLTISPFFQEYVPKDLAMSNITKGGTHITDNIIISAGSDESRITGGDLFCCVADEINIKPKNTSMDNFVENRIKMWEEVIDRKSGTLSKAPAMSGIVWLVSSPTEETDIINERIASVTKSKTPRVKILDNIARWVARDEVPEGMKDWNPDKDIPSDVFEFYLGSDTKDPRVLEDVPDRENYVWGEVLDWGIDFVKYESGIVIMAPRINPKGEDYKSWAIDSTIKFIRDISGRRTSSDMAFFTSVSIFEKVFKEDNDIFSKNILTINFMEGKQFDFEDYLLNKDYFNSCKKKNCYRYIHLDIGTKRDRFGLSSVYSDIVKLKSDNNKIEVNKRMYFVDFCLGIVASPGCEVDIIKVFEFLYAAKKAGYPIKKITTDSHQGILSVQHIKRHGVNSEILSVERTKDPYYNLRGLMLTQSLLGYKNDILVKELGGLRDYEEKIDKGKGYTDDLCGSLAGALFSCTSDKHGFKTSDEVMDDIIMAQTNYQNKSNKLNINEIMDVINNINSLDSMGNFNRLGGLNSLNISNTSYENNPNSNKDNKRKGLGYGF